MYYIEYDTPFEGMAGFETFDDPDEALARAFELAEVCELVIVGKES